MQHSPQRSQVLRVEDELRQRIERLAVLPEGGSLVPVLMSSSKLASTSSFCTL